MSSDPIDICFVNIDMELFLQEFETFFGLEKSSNMSNWSFFRVGQGLQTLFELHVKNDSEEFRIIWFDILCEKFKQIID